MSADTGGNAEGRGDDAVIAAARALIDDALEAFTAPPERQTLEAARRRLDEPLRVAIAGMVKAGKSTLLNAIIGDEIAPTDAGECTRIVTWYRHGTAPRITLHAKNGDRRDLPVKRIHGRLNFDIAPMQADDVERLVVEWPAAGLRSMTLIDTPGIASLSTEVSARATDFLTPTDAPSQADAVIYLMRHLHEADLGFLDAFRDSVAASSRTVNAIAVLSRADEVGAGRIDAMLSAHDVADRYRRVGALRALALDVVSVAGLLAQSARTLRESEFEALVELAQLERDDRERLLVSADRFVAPSDVVSVTPDARAALLERFGLFGVRIAASLLRGGVAPTSTALAQALRLQSGLDGLLDTVSTLFTARAELLKARGALATVAHLVRGRPDAVGSAGVAASLERFDANAHGLREFWLISQLRASGIDLDAELAANAERVIGAHGDRVRERLDLPAEATDDEARRRARALAHEWRAREADPRRSRAASRACAIVARSAEAQLARLGGSGDRVRARLALGVEPVAGPG